MADTVPTHVRIPANLHAELSALAASQERSISFIIIKAIEAYLKEQAK